MTPLCPHCQAEIPAARVNMAEGVAHCARCNQMFSLAALGAGLAAPAAAAQPADCDIQHVRDADSLGFILPPAGWKRAGTMVVFAVIWNCMVGFFVAVVLFHGEAEALVVMSLFVAVGLGFAVLALYGLFGTTSLLLDRQNVRLERKLFGRARTTVRPLADLAAVERRSAYQENRRDVWGVHLAFHKSGAGPSGKTVVAPGPAPAGLFSGGMTVATKRSPEEHAWMIGEIRQFLFTLGHPAWKTDDGD